MNENSRTLLYASEMLKKDKEFILHLNEAYKRRSVLVYAAPELKNDVKFMLHAVTRHPSCFYSASEELKSN